MDGEATRRKNDLASPADVPTGLFACNGEYWSLGYREVTFSLRDLRGLLYLQRLLQRPGEEISALELLRPPGANTASTPISLERHGSLPIGINVRPGLTGDAGEMLDQQAKLEYRHRIKELREEQDEVRGRGDHERVEEIETEIEFLTRELSRAIDYRGRDRRVGLVSERARISVRRAIKAALEKISVRHPPMGALFERTIRTGNFCLYVPNPSAPVAWQFHAPSQLNAKEKGEAQQQLARVVESGAEPDLWKERQPTSPLAQFNRGNFVGRRTERDQLRKSVEAAKSGRGSVVTIGGTSGVGKTRLIAEAADEVVGAMQILLGRCCEREAIAPYAPFVEVMEMVLEHARSLEDFRTMLDTNASELTRMMPQLRRLFPDLESPLEGTPEQQRRILVKNFCEFIERLTNHHPVMLILDDLQWADEPSLDLLEYLASKVPQLRLMIVADYRDHQSGISARFAQTLETLRRGHLGDHLQLQGLSPSEVAELVRLTVGKESSESLVKEIYCETDGNPFFVEETLKYLIEEKRLVDDEGNVRESAGIRESEVPQTVRLTIERMLQRLNATTRRILELAAVVGPRFGFEMLMSLQLFGAEELLDATKEGEDAGILISDPIAYESELGFSHELIRQTLLAGLSLPRRQRWHYRVAQSIERIYAASLEDRAAELAHHLTVAGPAGEPAKAVHYLCIAGKRALKAGDYADAIRQFERALGFMERLSQEPDRARVELEIKAAMHVALIARYGFRAPELEPLNARMLELCDEVADPPLSLSALLSAWAFHSNRGELDRATATSERMMRLAERGEFPLLELAANLSYGTMLFVRGEFVPARGHLERAISLYRPQFAGQLHVAHDLGVISLCYLSSTLLALGYLDQALAAAQRGVELAQRISETFTLVHAHFQVAATHLARGEADEAFRLAEIICSLSEENGYQQYLSLGTMMRGFALTELGRVSEGIAEVQAGIAKSPRASQVLGVTSMMGLLAAAYLRAKQKEMALALVASALNVVETTGERYFQSELYRLRGEALLLDSGEAADQEAEEMFRKASELASRFSHDFSALRAAISLCRLYKRQGRIEQAQNELQQVYERFTESFDIADMKMARELLRELK